MTPPGGESLWVRYGAAPACVVLAGAARLALDRAVGPGSAAPPVLLAVAGAAWLGGLGPALLATLLGAAFAFYHGEGSADVALLTCAGAVIALLGERLWRSATPQTAPEPATRASFRPLFDSNVIGIAFRQGDLFTDANGAFLRLVGCTRTDLPSLSCERITPPEYRAADARARLELVETGSCAPYAKEFLCKDGRRVPVLVGAARTGAGAEVVSFTIDLTAQKQAEEALRLLSEASGVLATSLDAEAALAALARLAVPRLADWCTVDLLGEDGLPRNVAVAHVEPAKAALARELRRRYPPGAPAGLMHVLQTGRSELIPEVPERLRAGAGRDPELVRLLRELGLRSYLAVPMRHQGRVLGVITFVAATSGRRFGPEDLSAAEDLASRAAVAVENARLYAELREADRRKDEFLATLAHELRNPLAPVRNAVHLLRLKSPDDPQILWARDVIERQVQQMSRLVDDLLDVSRISRGKVELRKQSIDLARVVADAIEATRPLIEQRRHRLTVALPDEPILLLADPTRLEQVLANLLNNAAKYTEPGGEISLSAERQGDDALVRVRDTGAGIAHEHLDSVFDMFVQIGERGTQTPGGLGIGLSLVRRLVELHGGTVVAHSEGSGKGSEFVVRLPALPAREPDAPAVAAAPTEAAAAGPARRVLVVDDNIDAAESLALMLRVHGHEVTVAYDGAGAVAAVRAGAPEVVFLDIGLPDRDGYTVARELRSLPGGARLLLIALTGWGQEDDRRRAMEAGFDYHLVKPVEPEAIEELLAHPRLA